MPTEIKEEYEKLSKKYKLPEFNDIDSAFEISTIENTSFLLREIIGKIVERLSYYTKLLEEFLQPDVSSLSGMHEISFFSDNEKHRVYQLYKKLMKLNRMATEADLSQNEKEEAAYILSAFNVWIELKNELIDLVKKMTECWEKENNMKQELGYFG